MRAVLVIGWLLLALAGCNSDDSSVDAGGDGEACDVTAPAECASDAPSYADVEPIFQEHCVVCHEGSPANELCPTCWPLTDETHIASWENEIRHVMLQCSMPPKESGLTMSNADRMQILEWLRCL